MKPINLKYILKLIYKKKKTLVIGQIITIFAIIFSIPIPLMLPTLVDELLLNKPHFFVNNINFFFGKDHSPFFYIAIVTLAVILLRIIYFVSTVIITKIFTSISKYVTFEIRKKAIEHLKEVCMNEYESLGSGAVSANLITDINTLDNFIITGASKFFASILTLIAVAFVMIAIHPILGFMILFIQPLIMILSKRISKKVGVLKKEENQSIEEFQNNLGESLDLFGQIKASNKENFFFKGLIKKAKNIQTTSNEYSYKSVAFERLSFTIFLITFEILRASGLIMVAYSDLSIGMMFAMFGYIWFIITPVQDILSMQYSYSTAMGAVERINKIFNLKKELNGNQSLKKNLDSLHIKVNNLNFSYNKNKLILKDICLDIKPKEKIALIGASGSGKTTLAQIIAGFYAKDSGEILYNDINIDNLNKSTIRENIFLVLQMPILFNNTLRFNITMGNEELNDEKILEALEIAQLKDIVLNMKDGLDTIVGKHGIRLSGGQRQRLSIARMIIANPQVVIFDESTSALDIHTEAKLFNSLTPILKEKTIITIAHRLSTVQNANKIYVLEEGSVVQQGTHAQLIEEEGHYLQFIKKQMA